MTKRGFTLAELLIALAILGIIATFTIPKVLQGQQDTRFKAMGKEFAATISGAYQAYKLEHGTPPSDMNVSDLTPYLNYVRQVTTGTVDYYQTTSTEVECFNAAPICFELHNGAIFYHNGASEFAGTGSTNAIAMWLDPDGKFSGTSDGPGKAVWFFLYYDGRISTKGNLLPGTLSQGFPVSANENHDPPWFGWD